MKSAITTLAVLVACAAWGDALAAEPVQAISDLKGASVVALSVLPHSPENGKLDDYCEGYREKKLSDTGRLVANAGWIVTSEARLGSYDVVTFVSGFDPGTSGLCFARNANVGIFKGSSLVALAYTFPASDRKFGIVEPLESGDLLVWGDEGIGAPVGELHTDDRGLRLTHIAPERTFCNFKAVVPNIYGKPLDAARAILIAHGWQPVRPKEQPGELDNANTLAKRGVIEAESCSGTGVGYCAFNYKGSAGILGVTTVGGEPKPADNTVVQYDVACSGHQSHH
ncbi:MAG: hypothetical protein JF605_23695 [Burkholderia sp.]|nr:hypothetical protein [Burkholderia sp.]